MALQFQGHMRYQKSLEIEQRLAEALQLIQAGQYSAPKLAESLGVSIPTVSRYVTALRERGHPGQITAGKTLEAKLTDAGIPGDQFEGIAEMRMRYRLEGLAPRYTESIVIKTIEETVSARLLMLRAQLDGGLLENNGARFHATCLTAITDVVNALPEADRPPLQNLFGYMYNLADRCTHRFVRAKT